MNNIVKSVFNYFGYDLRRSVKSTKWQRSSRTGNGTAFLQDDKFEIDFTRLTVSGDQYFVPNYATHRPAARSLLNGEMYEPDTHDFVRDFCKSFKGSIVHAGTFFGDMIPDFSNAVSGRVYAFEPVFENYILAKLCVDNNNISNVILINSALSERVGNLYIDTNESYNRHAGGASRISDTGVICVAINIDSLDIDDLVLIQLDVEGHELSALTGAQSSIQKNRPVIAIEDNKGNCAEFLADLKYEIVGHIPGLTIWAPTENTYYKNIIESFLGRHKA